MKIIRILPRFRRAYKSLPALAARESWRRERIESWQLERLNALWQHATAHVPYYRRLAVQERLPQVFGDLREFRERVPLLPKQSVIQEPESFLSERPDRGAWRRTGGSTGTPMKVYWGEAAYRDVLQARYRFLEMWGIDIFDSSAFLWGHSASFAPGLKGQLARIKQPLEDLLRNRLRLSAYRLGRDDLRDGLKRLAAGRPTTLYGYSRAIYLLAQQAEASRVLCDSLKLITLTGEPALPHIVETVEHAFGVPAVIEYGSIECGLVALEWPDRTLRVREDMVIVETVPSSPGYNIVVTVLGNPSFPLLRYELGDITDQPLQLPDRGFAVLHNVAGRNNDFVQSRSGRHLHSARFDAFFKYEARGVRCFRVHQTSDGSLSVTLVIDEPTTFQQLSELERKLSVLVDGHPVSIKVVETIPLTPAGKHRLVVSELGGDGVPAPPSPINGGRMIRLVRDSTAHTRVDMPRDPKLPSGSVQRPTTKGGQLRYLIERPELSFLLEAHSGLSAKVVEEAGFEGIWASGLCISAALGVRDSNEASWTQVLEVLEFMSDATSIPILLDGDTGYGNFNNVRRLVRKLEERSIAGVCIEDKIFPKTNSLLQGGLSELADIDEFCGKIAAAKDAQQSRDFVVVARIEAFIAGFGLAEAMKRAEAYAAAGADAILIHSSKRSPSDVLSFKQEWGNRLPVLIVPTKYYETPTSVFREHGFAAAIWANHLMRSALDAMQKTARQIFENESLTATEPRVATLEEVFRLQGTMELQQAERRYLPLRKVSQEVAR